MTSGADEIASVKIGQGRAQERGPQLPSKCGKLFDRSCSGLAGVRVALPDERHDDLFDQARFPIGGAFVAAEVPGLDAMAGKRHRQAGDGSRLPAVIARASNDPGYDEGEPFELAHGLFVSTGLLEELFKGEFLPAGAVRRLSNLAGALGSSSSRAPGAVRPLGLLRPA